MRDKKKHLFYYCDAVSGYVPVGDLTIADITDSDNMDDLETLEIEFKMFEMTEDEINNLPVE